MAGFLEQALTGRVASFFLVFPDCDAVTPLAHCVRDIAAQSLAHASGRPWLLGRWADDECVVLGEGHSRVAVIGSIPPADAVRERWRTWPEMVGAQRLAESMAESLPGSFHLVTSAGGEVTVSGTASGVRLVFSARVGAVTVAASRADVLAELLGAGLDETQVAVRLLSAVPHPMPLASMWRGVRTVEPGSRLRLGRDGSERTVVWWKPPVPDQPLSAGAPRIGAALSEAVGARTDYGGTVTCDLSGGLDCTAICFLAATGPAKVIARSLPEVGADPDWVRLVAANLPEVEHVDLPGEDRLGTMTAVQDEPTLAMLSLADLERFYFPLASWGGRVHLTGFGGDHVGWCGPAPAPRWLGGFPAAADRRRYQKWLFNSAYQLLAPQRRPDWTHGWSPPLRLPEWVTPAAATAVRKAVIRAAATAEPIAPGRGAHAELSAIRLGSRWLRQVEQVCAAAGLPIASPFLDDRVVRAYLSIRPADRATPVLRAALRGIVADEFLARTEPGPPPDGARLPALWDGSRLAAMGIIDEKVLRARTYGPQHLLDGTAALELWLRSVLPQQNSRASAQVAWS